MIEHQSFLRRYPAGLSRPQIACIDGVRLAAQITDMAYRRLQRHLAALPALPMARERGDAATPNALDSRSATDFERLRCDSFADA
jgi:hypothetical protein